MSFFKKKQLDLLAIGDSVTDAFIRLKDASVHCSIHKDTCELCMRFGDKIPYESATVINGVGNSPNAAVSASRLGLSVGLISHTGGDMYGKEVISSLTKERIDTSFINIEKNKPSNYHYVLWYEDDRTILIKHTAFSYIFTPPPTAPRWIYLSSLGDHTESYHDAIANYLEKNTSIKVAFQPGTFQIKLGLERLKKIYARSNVFVCNTDEAKIILKDTTSDTVGLLKKMHAHGPSIVLITDGPKGAYAYDGQKILFQPPYPDPKPPYERTGAGDAFASTFVSALCLGLSVEDALQWAPINSMSVVQHIGAQEGLLTQDKLKEYLKKAPANYKPRLIS